MIITIDYDNNAIRLQSSEHYEGFDIEFKKVNIKEIEPIIREIINMLHDPKNENDLIQKQDEGMITVIEEY